MFDKSFEEMRQVDVSEFVAKKYLNVEKTKFVEYLNWAKCIDLLHQSGAEKVYYEPVLNPVDNSPLFTTGNEYHNSIKEYVDGKAKYVDKTTKCYEVRVKIVIDNIEFVQNYPLIKGKDAVYEDEVNQFVIDYAQKRAFVKGVAIRTGLGLDLWIKDEDKQNKEETEQLPINVGYLKKLKEYAQELYTKAFSQKHKSQEEIVEAMNVANFDVLVASFSKFDECQKFIYDLWKLV